jgi:hypothetical protein
MAIDDHALTGNCKQHAWIEIGINGWPCAIQGLKEWTLYCHNQPTAHSGQISWSPL